MKGQAYNAQMKAAHENTRGAIYRQRSPTLSLSPDLVEFLIQLLVITPNSHSILSSKGFFLDRTEFQSLIVPNHDNFFLGVVFSK